MLWYLLFLPLVVDATGPVQANYSLPGLFTRYAWLFRNILMFNASNSGYRSMPNKRIAA